MPKDRDQYAEDLTAQNRRLGSVMLTVGWILLWGDAIFGVFFFQSLRNGSLFWPVWLAIEGIAGLALVIMGSRYRRAVGVTRLARADWEHTQAEEQREREENRRVA